MPAECLDDYPPLTVMHQAINERKPVEVVRFLANEAKNEDPTRDEALSRVEKWIARNRKVTTQRSIP